MKGRYEKMFLGQKGPEEWGPITEQRVRDQIGHDRVLPELAMDVLHEGQIVTTTFAQYRFTREEN